MTVVVELPYNDEVAKTFWPSFKVTLEEKHGDNGKEGHRGEQNAIKLLKENFDFDVLYDHGKDVISQLHGIDFTAVKIKRKFITIDAKSGRSNLYYDRNEQYWYITLREDIFVSHKFNTHVMHVGPKGDLFAYYDKEKMNEFRKKSGRLIADKYGYRLKVKDFPDFVHHNISIR